MESLGFFGNPRVKMKHREITAEHIAKMLKKQFPGTIVMFRLGDFYESFDDDAKKVADACNIGNFSFDSLPGQC